MHTDLIQKTALVTGAAIGIGQKTAFLLAERGAHVIVADINQAAGQATVQTIVDAGGSAEFVVCDVTQESQLVAAIELASLSGHRLDIMVNNAGIGGQQGPIHMTEQAVWDRVLLVNLTAVFWGQKYAVQAMLKDGKGGSIVNISSIAGLGASYQLNAYGVSKAGVIQLTQTGATEVARHGIRINVVCPGWTETAIIGMADEQARARMLAPVPMRRMGAPEEIAQLIAFLASDASSFITGSVHRIDGGLRS